MRILFIILSFFLVSDNIYSQITNVKGNLIRSLDFTPGKQLYFDDSGYIRPATADTGLVGGGTVQTVLVAYVDSAFGNNSTALINRPDKPFLTINAALDATASLPKRIIQISSGTYASPDSAKIISYTWFRGSGKPKPNWTVAVPSVDGDTKTAPTALIGGTILQGSFWFNAYRLQNVIITDLGVDVGSAWCTANNAGNPAEGLLFATAYIPGSGNAADGGHFLQSGTTPCQGVIVNNVAVLCQNATAAVHAALFENLFSPNVSGITTYFGTHGIVFKTIGGTASDLQAFGHSFNGIIIKSNDYANCYRLTLSNFTIGSIGVYDGGGLILDANDAGSPGLYFCTISNGTINRTTFGIRTQGTLIDGNNLSNIEVNVASGNGVDLLTGFAYGTLENVKARTCGGIGFNVASTEIGITINDCDAQDNTSDGFRFTGSSNVNFDNLNAISNDGWGINVVSGSVNGGTYYMASNVSGAVTGTIIPKNVPNWQAVTNVGATTTNATSITGYSTTGNKFRVGDFAFQPYGLNNSILTDNSDYNGSAWTRFNIGYASRLHFFNGQVMLAGANTGSGAPTWMQGFKTDFNGHVGLGGNIDDVTFSGAKLYIDGSTGATTFNNAFTFPTADGTSGQVLQTNGSGVVTWQTPGGATTIYNGNGTLGSDRNVSSGGNTLRFDGANNSDTLVSITNTGTSSTGLYSIGSLFGIDAQSTNVGLRTFGAVAGILATGDGSEGAVIRSNTIRGATIQSVPSSTNTVQEVLRIERGVDGSPGADGIGGSVDFYNKVSDNSSVVSNQFISKFTNATIGTRISQLSITGVNAGSTGTIATFDGNGNVTFGATNALVGTATNNNAVAGNIGEYVESNITSGSAVSLTTATSANVTSISLTAGDWDVDGIINYSMTGATTANFSSGSNSTSATLGGDNTFVYTPFSSAGFSDQLGEVVPKRRFSLSGTTTIYLVGNATFSVGSASAYGLIRARRVR